MKTVPFWLSPLQYCAGNDELLTQSGYGAEFVNHLVTQSTTSGLTLIPQRKGDTDVPTTGSWLIARTSVFLRIERFSSLIIES